jgi:uncharacterized membrane protein
MTDTTPIDAAAEAVAPASRRLLSRPTFGGLAVGLSFWWASLSPTLMPRTWVTQAAMSALSFAVGIAVGTLLSHLVHRGLDHYGKAPSATFEQRAWQVLAGVGLVALVAGGLLWPRWQNDQNDLVTLGHISRAVAVPMLALTLVLTVVLAVIGRLVGSGVGAVNRFNQRHLPGLLAVPTTVVLVILVVVLLGRNVLVDAFVSSTSAAFATVDDTTEDGVVPPSAATSSGSPDSLIPWDTLGQQGRTFVARATTAERLREFHGADAEVQAPVRVYAGLRSADSTEERAELAVRDLERAGGFERAVLVVTTVTGTGWVDPDAAIAVEQLYAGDSAIVGMQYSYLPSWIATLVDDGKAAEAGAALFNAVHARWSELPAGQRPKLVAYGVSLGSYGAEAAFAGPDAATSIANMVARTDGVLLAGPTADNPVYQQIVAGRDAGSPAWQPVFDGGESVRFQLRDPDVTEPEGEWQEPRIVYLSHPSDPVTFAALDTFWSRPEWMEHPRGFDVPDRGRWFPIVTGIQSVFDLMAGFAAPPGFGHDYRLDYVRGFAAIVPPDGWTDADTTALESFLTGG